MQGLRLRLAQAYSKYGEPADGSATQQIQAFTASQQKVGEQVGLGLLDFEQSIDTVYRNGLLGSVGPSHDQRLHLGRLSQAESNR